MRLSGVEQRAVSGAVDRQSSHFDVCAMSVCAPLCNALLHVKYFVRCHPDTIAWFTTHGPSFATGP